MADLHRPNPDDLLAAIKKSDARLHSGRLRVFFGMAAGVGKTYAMLKAAQARRAENVDVVVGIVETHNRQDTNQLLAGLAIIPRRHLNYKGADLEEMDLDAVLARKPQLVLVDELAHTNVPGSRHHKRWQDVVELLDAGIDVYTTLNVQHVESRKEYVEQITGITIREMVPDTILQRAVQMVLVDITPAELLQRLKEGKVYLGERAEAAANNFFKEDRLTALREIALRLTAEAVDNELQELTATREQSGPWKTTERLMVAVSHSPHSEDLIRATRRLAFSISAPWIAVNVDTGAGLNDSDRRRLAQNLTLVRELGGEVISITDVDIVEALLQIAHQRSITQLVIGHPVKHWFRDLFTGGTLLDRLARHATTFDIHVLKPARVDNSPSANRLKLTSLSSPMSYWYMLWVIFAVALVSKIVMPFIGYRAVGFVFLLGVLAVSLFVSIGPAIFAALLAAFTWDYFFIPPTATFFISQPEDMAMCLALLVTALVTGVLTSRIRRRERMLRLREQRTEVLYQVARAISAAADRRAFAGAVSEHLAYILHGEIGIAWKNADGQIERIASGASQSWMTSEKEWLVALWAFEHGKAAGWSTDTLASAEAWYIPLIGPTETIGVLAFKPGSDKSLTHDEESLLLTVARQMAVAGERDFFKEQSRQAEQLAESEKLYQTILNSVSHEIRTPLTAIIGSASALQNDAIISNPENRHQLLEELTNGAERLNGVVTNLLDLSRLNSGMLSLKLDWHDLNDLISVVLSESKRALMHHAVTVISAENMPLVRIDIGLFKHAVSNLLTNAAAYTPSGTTIQIATSIIEGAVLLLISDNGSGVPEGSLSHLFDKFYRVPGTPTGGTGIGLAIAKAIVEAHGGTIGAANAPGGGLCFTIKLNLDKQPQLPEDRSLL